MQGWLRCYFLDLNARNAISFKPAIKFWCETSKLNMQGSVTIYSRWSFQVFQSMDFAAPLSFPPAFSILLSWVTYPFFSWLFHGPSGILWQSVSGSVELLQLIKVRCCLHQPGRINGNNIAHILPVSQDKRMVDHPLWINSEKKET